MAGQDIINLIMADDAVANEAAIIAAINATQDDELNDKDENEPRGTALIYAAGLGYTEIVKALLLKKTNINATDKHGYSALMHAAKHGHYDCMTELVSKGAFLDYQSKDGETALMLAANPPDLKDKKTLDKRIQNKIICVKYLLNAGADPRLLDNKKKDAYEHARQHDVIFEGVRFAIINKNNKNYKKMINENYYNDLNREEKLNYERFITDSLEAPPLSKLFYTIMANNEKRAMGAHEGEQPRYKINLKRVKTFCELHIQAGNSDRILNQADSTGNTPLMVALKLNQTDIAAYLIGIGAKVNVKNAISDTPLFLAIQSAYEKDMMNSDEEQDEDDLDTLLYKLNTHTFKDIAERLIDQGADVNVSDFYGVPLLIYAMALQDEAFVMKVMNGITDDSLFTKTNQNGETALMVAAHYGYETVVDELLKKGVDPHVKNKEGMTALNMAISRKRENTKAGIDSGAHVRIEEKIRAKMKLISPPPPRPSFIARAMAFFSSSSREHPHALSEHNKPDNNKTAASTPTHVTQPATSMTTPSHVAQSTNSSNTNMTDNTRVHVHTSSVHGKTSRSIVHSAPTPVSSPQQRPTVIIQIDRNPEQNPMTATPPTQTPSQSPNNMELNTTPLVRAYQNNRKTPDVHSTVSIHNSIQIPPTLFLSREPYQSIKDTGQAIYAEISGNNHINSLFSFDQPQGDEQLNLAKSIVASALACGKSPLRLMGCSDQVLAEAYKVCLVSGIPLRTMNHVIPDALSMAIRQLGHHLSWIHKDNIVKLPPDQFIAQVTINKYKINNVPATGDELARNLQSLTAKTQSANNHRYQ